MSCTDKQQRKQPPLVCASSASNQHWLVVTLKLAYESIRSPACVRCALIQSPKRSSTNHQSAHRSLSCGLQLLEPIMKHTIHIKITQETMQHAVQAVMNCPELPEPSSLTGAVRTCFNMGIAALDPGHHLRPVTKEAISLYNKLSGTRDTQPTQEQLYKMLGGQPQAVNPSTDHRLSKVSPADLEKAQRILSIVDQGHLTPEQQLSSSNEEVARISKLIWPTEASDN